MTLSPFANVLQNALFRALIVGLLTLIIAWVSTWLLTDEAFLSKGAFGPAFAAFTTVIAARGGIEGLLDSQSSQQQTADRAKVAHRRIGPTSGKPLT